MRFLTRATALLFLSLAFSVPIRAATITFSDLPGSIQSCITAATCFVSNTSTYDNGTASAFSITQSTGSGTEDNVLMRYAMVPPSSQSTLDPPQNDALSGYLWMLTKTFYSAAETAHPITLYIDKVSPTPINFFGSGDISLTMTTADLVTGSGYRTLGLDGNNNSYDYGYLSGDIHPPCLAENCMSYTQLNLAQLMYGDFGTQIGLYAFNPSDTRGLVYIRGTSSPGYPGGPGPTGTEQSFYVSAVPLPGAVWLFGSGLLGLLGVSRRRKATQVRHQ